jgi:hypothetical protein
MHDSPGLCSFLLLLRGTCYMFGLDIKEYSNKGGVHENFKHMNKNG